MKKVMLILLSLLAGAGTAEGQVLEHRLESSDGLDLIGVKVEPVTLDGKSGLRVTRAADAVEGRTLVIVSGTEFHNGSIELEVAGEPAPGADPNMRGFVGVAFRIDPLDPDRYECFYLRPTNARADAQLRRNHSTQYVSHPEYPWYRLRQESPGVYESYVDLIPGAWTTLRIEVEGTRARLYVNGADQPTLIVDDLKHGESSGQVGLWLHSSTLAHFRGLSIQPSQ